MNRQSEKQIEDREVRGCWGGWEHGSLYGRLADIKLRKAVAAVPLDRRAVYNLDKRMRCGR